MVIKFCIKQHVYTRAVYFRRRNIRGQKLSRISRIFPKSAKKTLWLIRESLCPRNISKFYPWKKSGFKIGLFQQYVYKISNNCPVIQKKKQKFYGLRKNCWSEIFNYIVDPRKCMYAKRIKKAHPRKFLSAKHKNFAEALIRESFYA